MQTLLWPPGVLGRRRRYQTLLVLKLRGQCDGPRPGCAVCLRCAAEVLGARWQAGAGLHAQPGPHRRIPVVVRRWRGEILKPVVIAGVSGWFNDSKSVDGDVPTVDFIGFYGAGGYSGRK